ncbi:hypothetical protein NKH91_31115 [Mesorhizobium sp. M0894]|uniref:hypothetical protein n=1 Tax=unclassified Mesorhizobium TaxID=325217 RepID=UPI003335BA15
MIALPSGLFLAGSPRWSYRGQNPLLVLREVAVEMRDAPVSTDVLNEDCLAEQLRERIREKAAGHRNERAGLQLVRMAIEQTCPAGVLPSEEAVLPVHEGEALAKAIIETVKRLTAQSATPSLR